MDELTCKVLVIGAGPGGYVCAIRAGQLGLDTIIVDPQAPGGTCLNVGCIPSKALIHAAEEFHRIAHASAGPLGITAGAPKLDLAQTLAWKNGIVRQLNAGVSGLLNKAKVRQIEGTAHFLDGKTVRVATATGEATIRAEKIVIATGSEPVELPFMPFGGDILSSTEALALSEVPKELAVIGGGYIGLELGTAFAKLGAKVTMIEAGARILPQYDAALTAPIMNRLKELGVEVRLESKAVGFDAGVLATDRGSLPADKVLVTVGRRPRLGGLRLDNLVLSMNAAFVRVDNTCETSMRGVYAIGDVTGEPMLAHRAMAQGEMVADILAGQRREWDKVCIPAVCFTDPEVVSCGAMPGEIEGSATTMFPFQANGRAMTQGRDDGFLRVVWREADGAVLGMQGAGHGISEMSAAFALAIEMGARLDDIAATIHAHPTQGEALQEACLKALGKALHI